jgi:hypothetical protein
MENLSIIYILKTFIFYGNIYYIFANLGHFPADLLKDIFILLWFQEQGGKIYESYIQSIKNSNN